jgi:hypothetical protein
MVSRYGEDGRARCSPWVVEAETTTPNNGPRGTRAPPRRPQVTGVIAARNSAAMQTNAINLRWRNRVGTTTVLYAHRKSRASSKVYPRFPRDGSFAAGSLLPERDGRIHPQRPPRRHDSSQKSDEQQRRHDSCVRPRIADIDA